jgi:hypothetical protein
MMKTIVALLPVLFSINALAHVEIGEYTGLDKNGATCGFTVKSVTFVDNVQHPLNERITITWGSNDFILQHLPQIDTEKNLVGFEHGKLTGTRANSSSAVAAVLVMDHSEGHEGPSTLNIVTQSYDNTENSNTISCKQLAVKKP